MTRPSPDLLRGTLDMLILRVLSEEPCHGYAIGQRIEDISGDRLKIEQGSLYPALYRLERGGWLRSQWQRSSASTRRAKVYRLTRQGRQRLEADVAHWQRFADGVSQVVQGR